MTERLDDSGAGGRCWGQIAAVIKREEGDVCRVMMAGALLITTPCGRAVLVVGDEGTRARRPRAGRVSQAMQAGAKAKEGGMADR